MGFFFIDSFIIHDYLLLMRYKIYSIEHGSQIADPYDEDEMRAIAEIVAKCMAEATKCRWFVYDMVRKENVYLMRGDLQFANRKLKTGESNDQD